MSYFVYILFSEKDKKLYVGCSTKLKQRVKAHNPGQVPATKNRRPLSLIHSEKIEDKAEAFKRERYLKSLWSARFKRKLRDAYLKNRRAKP